MSVSLRKVQERCKKKIIHSKQIRQGASSFRGPSTRVLHYLGKWMKGQCLTVFCYSAYQSWAGPSLCHVKDGMLFSCKCFILRITGFSTKYSSWLSEPQVKLMAFISYSLALPWSEMVCLLPLNLRKVLVESFSSFHRAQLTSLPISLDHHIESFDFPGKSLHFPAGA
jgi:hypothetical protein